MLELQQISDSVLPSLGVCVKVVTELFTPVCVGGGVVVVVVSFTCTVVAFPVDGAEVLIYMTSSVDVVSVALLVLCGCDVGIVELGSGVVIVVLLICVVVLVSIAIVLLRCSLG